MKFIDLKKTLEKTSYSVYFVQGDDRFLMQKAQDILIAHYIKNAPELNLQIINEDNYSMQAIVENAQTFPFCNDYRLILIRGMPEKITENDQKIFDNYIKNPVKQTVLVFVFDDKTAFYTKNFMSVTNIDCNKMTKQFLTKYVATLLSKYKKAITMDAVELFLDFCDYDLTKIENECSKLSLALKNETITKQDILDNVPKSVDYQIFELSEAISSRDGVNAIKILKFLLDRKISTQYIMGVIVSYMRRMFYASVTEDSDFNIAKMLGVKEYAITATRNKCKNFKKV